jgi:hypothetical protein
MKTMKLLAVLAVTCAPVVLAAQPTVFDISGTVAVYGGGGGPPYPLDTFSGTVDINTVTGTVTGADVVFGSPYPGVTVAPITLNGYETAPGPPGSHVADIELCADTVCSQGWYLNMTVNIPSASSTLVGYAGGKIKGLGLWFADVPSAWAGCPGQAGTPDTCGGLTLKSGGGGGKTGVPEPASALLLLLGLGAAQLRRRRAH